MPQHVGQTAGESVYFELSVLIDRPPEDVFMFLRDKHLVPQEPGSPVLELQKVTPQPVGVGTRYREVVQMLPLVRGCIHSEITRFEPPRFLEEDFRGAGMQGHLAYEIVQRAGGALLIQRETLAAYGPLRLLTGLIGRALAPRLQERLECIRSILESGWRADLAHAAQQALQPEAPERSVILKP